MKSPFFLLLLLRLHQGRCRTQGSVSNEFRPSTLISFEKEDNGKSSRPAVVNSFNVTVAYPPAKGRGETTQEEPQSEGTFNHPVTSEAEGRTFETYGGHSGGWGGVANTFCEQHHGFNLGCCSLGYPKCCGNGKPSGHGFYGEHVGGGWGGGGGHHHQYPGPVYHRPPPIRPVLPVVPLRPSIPLPVVPIRRPIVYPNRPPPHHHHHHQHQHQSGSSGWNRVEKPGSCKSSSFSFLNKFNFLNKAKDIFMKGDSHGGSKGWGWEPPSHNGGWHFYRRSDSSFPRIPFLTKRQVSQGPSLSSTNTRNVFVIGGSDHKESSDNALFHRTKSPSPFYDDNNNLSMDDTATSGSSWGNVGPSGGPRLQGRSHQASPYNQYPHPPRTVGIGSLSGRTLSGWGWNSNSNHHHHNHRCRIDYDCPGHDKCCEGICRAPSFFG